MSHATTSYPGTCQSSASFDVVPHEDWNTSKKIFGWLSSIGTLRVVIEPSCGHSSRLASGIEPAHLGQSFITSLLKSNHRPVYYDPNDKPSNYSVRNYTQTQTIGSATSTRHPISNAYSNNSNNSNDAAHTNERRIVATRMDCVCVCLCTRVYGEDGSLSGISAPSARAPCRLRALRPPPAHGLHTNLLHVDLFHADFLYRVTEF
jgi:hypothetical protein